jgi:hypothetical protein
MTISPRGHRHPYHQTLTYKIFCARKNEGAAVRTTFAECLDVIRGVQHLTGGLPQIVYLVGWQHAGHDAGYPDWSLVNPRLAPGEDAVAALRQLMVAARALGATVSLHLNMDDAYPSSPLWDEYVRHDLLLRHADGRVMDGDVWDGELCRWICKSREWAAGLAQRRIDALCALLPLSEQGTVHIDVFRPNPSPGHGTTWDDEVVACRAIVGHWRSHGIDVTVEYLADPSLADLHPMILHDQRDEQQRLTIPPDVVCGGGAAWNTRWRTVRDGAPGWWGGFCAPAAGCRYPEVWGNSLDHDLAQRGPGFLRLSEVPAALARTTLVWHHLNRQRAVEHRHTPTLYEVLFDGGARSSVRVADRHHTVHQDGRLLVDGEDRCLPAPWLGTAAFAWHGSSTVRRWDLGPTWRTVSTLSVELRDGGDAPITVPCRDGVVELTLPPLRLALLRPS